MNRTTITIAGERRTFFATADGKIFESVANGSCPEVGQWPRYAATLKDALGCLMPESHECAQCRKAQQSGSHATGYFKGHIFDRRGMRVPYRGWLCEDHAELLHNDGAELRMA